MSRQAGAKAIVAHENTICLVLRDNIPTIPNPNTWNMPGGGIDEGESPREAIIRELKEEINLDATDVIETGVTTYSDGSVVYRYFVPVTDEQFKTMYLVSEGQKLAWLTFDEALALVDNVHLATYLETHAGDIRELLAGKRDFSPKNETLSID